MAQEKKEVSELQNIANEIRLDVVTMLSAAQSGHPGGSLSIVDILTALFFNVMNMSNDSDRDRFHLSKGHGCPTLYAILSRLGHFPKEELVTLRQFGSRLQGHPHPKTPGIEVASGSLGQGLSIACGMALASRLDKKGSCVYVVLGDGELQEGQVWEAAQFAAHYKLDNLCVIIDANGLQIDGKVSDIMNVEPIGDKWQAFGFHVKEVDGHNIEEIINTIEDVKKVPGKPKVIVAHTVKGKGVSFMEHNVNFHGKTTTEEETRQAMDELKRSVKGE